MRTGTAIFNRSNGRCDVEVSGGPAAAGNQTLGLRPQRGSLTISP